MAEYSTEPIIKNKFGFREDGTPKGNGWLGVLKMKNGSKDVMSEYSIGVEIGGRETLIPTLVPTLENDEINHLLRGGKPTNTIIQKAVDHAIERLKLGLSPFKD